MKFAMYPKSSGGSNIPVVFVIHAFCAQLSHASVIANVTLWHDFCSASDIKFGYIVDISPNY